MIKDVLKEIKEVGETVRGFKGFIPDTDIQNILIKLGIINGFVLGKQKVRIAFPKTFSIQHNKDYVNMQEETPTDKIFCSEDMYDVVVDAVIEMQTEREDFNRYTLFDAAKEIEPRVQIPALLVPFHYWISMENPLIEKQENDLYRVTCEVSEFREKANEAWDAVSDGSITIGNR